MSAPTVDRPTRTWDDPDGPMIEPEAPSWIDDAVRLALDGLNPTAATVLAIQGRHVSDRMAAKRAAFLADWERRQAQAAQNPVSVMKPRGDGYIPRIPRDTPPAPLAAACQSNTNARSAA